MGWCWWCLLAVGRASAYVVVSRCVGRCDGAAVAWARNPKTGSSVVVEDVLGLAPHTSARRPLVECGASRLATMTTRHEVGCVAPCPPRGPLAVAPTATRADADAAAALIGADLRFVVVREPVDRFASAWAFLRRKHADEWGSDDAGAFVASLHANASGLGLTAAGLVAARGPRTKALWPQSYWYDAALARGAGTAALVCYDRDALVDDVVALFVDEFGCSRTRTGEGSAPPPRANVGAPDGALVISAGTAALLRSLYARDAALWDRYCGRRARSDCGFGGAHASRLRWPALRLPPPPTAKATCSAYARPSDLLRAARVAGAADAWDARLRAARTWPRVETFVLFVGASRSGHSLVGALLDAHPDALIAEEADALSAYLDGGLGREALFGRLADSAGGCGAAGRLQTGYNYTVPQMWNGQWRCARGPKVLGDKQGRGTAKRLARASRNASELAPIRAFFAALGVKRVACVYVDVTGPRDAAKDAMSATTDAALRALVDAAPGGTAVEVLRVVDFACHPRAILGDLLRFLDLDAGVEGYADAAVARVDRRFCGRTGARTQEERASGVFVAGQRSYDPGERRGFAS